MLVQPYFKVRVDGRPRGSASEEIDPALSEYVAAKTHALNVAPWKNAKVVKTRTQRLPDGTLRRFFYIEKKHHSPSDG